MPFYAHDLSVAVFERGLTHLKSLLLKGEAHASANAIDPGDLINARLADDESPASVHARAMTRTVA
jgi:uncharacterized protein